MNSKFVYTVKGVQVHCDSSGFHLLHEGVLHEIKSQNDLEKLGIGKNYIAPVYTILSYTDHTTNLKAKSILRHKDNEVFSLGDRVTDGTAICGKITDFHFTEGSLFVAHTYSGVGMGFEGIEKVPEWPSKYQQGDAVSINKPGCIVIPKATIIKVHYSEKNTQYDLQLWLNHSQSIRIYNIQSDLLEDFI